jgi:hypothetical protein
VSLPGSCSITGSDRSLNWSGVATRTAGTAVATREPHAAIDAGTAVGAVVTGPALPGPTVTADAGVASTPALASRGIYCVGRGDPVRNRVVDLAGDVDGPNGLRRQNT